MKGLDMRDWIGTGEAGRRLKMHPVSVVRLINQKRLRAERTALGYLVDPESVEQLRRQREGDSGDTASSDTQLRRNELAYPTM